MKRAKVRRDFPGCWSAQVNAPTGDPSFPLAVTFWPNFPTHAAALAHALAEVGLTEKNTEKETNR